MEILIDRLNRHSPAIVLVVLFRVDILHRELLIPAVVVSSVGIYLNLSMRFEVGTERKSDQNFFIRPTNVEFHADSNGLIHSSI